MRLASLAREPWRVLVPLVLVQWAAVAAFALTVRHNGWLYYQGGDQTFYYTSSWALSHAHLPPAYVGYGWSYATMPIALFAGKSLLTALPAIVLLQTLVLLPLALLCVYAIGARLGGRLIGYAAAAAWIAVPFAAIPLFDPRYHARYVEQFLPQALGLTNLADFPSTICLLAAAALTLRALDGRRSVDAAAAGLLAGFAIGIKPANGLFLFAPALAFATVRAWRPLLPYVLGLAPALLTLALWKERGLGRVPVFSAPEARLAAGALVPQAGLLASSIGRYVDLDWAHLGQNFTALREFFWSVRVVEWLPVAGLVAVARLSLARAVFLGAWLAAFLLVKGTTPLSTVESGSFFRFLMPAFPAFLLLAASIPLAVPTLGPRLARRFAPAGAPRRLRRAELAALAAVLGAVPLLLIVSMPKAGEQAVARYIEQGVLLPTALHTFPLSATATPAGVRLTWKAPATGTVRSFFRVFRARADDGVPCNTFPGGMPDCYLNADALGTTRRHTWLDRPGRGRFTYRVGLSANWRDDPSLGDVLLLSPPSAVIWP